MEKERIVSDGRIRVLKDPETCAQISQTTAKIKEQFEQKMKGVGLCARFVLWIRMRKAVRQAVEKIAPSSGCYFKH